MYLFNFSLRCESILAETIEYRGRPDIIVRTILTVPMWRNILFAIYT